MTFETFSHDAATWLNRPCLSTDLRIGAWLAAANALAQQRPTQWLLEMGLTQGMPVLALKEILLQNYLFCGFPSAIEGLIVLGRVLEHRGIPNDDFRDERSVDRMSVDGEALCRRIYDKNFDRLAAHFQSLSKDMFAWMIQEGYGKVLSRGILGAPAREFAVMATLAVTRRERQLISHLKGARHVGASLEGIRECLESQRLLVSEDTVTLSLEILEQTFPTGTSRS